MSQIIELTSKRKTSVKQSVELRAVAVVIFSASFGLSAILAPTGCLDEVWFDALLTGESCVDVEIAVQSGASNGNCFSKRHFLAPKVTILCVLCVIL